MKKVALLLGGWSNERQVSLDKGRAVTAALEEAGYDVAVIDVQKDLAKFVSQIEAAQPDVIFNNLYGTGGEDGVIQGVLEMLGIPYTHSGVMASSIAMDKQMTKKIAAMIGVQTPRGVVVDAQTAARGEIMPKPYVAKPAADGSSVGIYVIKNEGDHIPAIPQGWEGKDILVEEYIKGRELTVAVLDGEAQSVTEIIPKNGFFDYEAKYQADDTQYVLPAQISEDVSKQAMDWAEKIYAELGCKGLARCDYRYDDAKNGTEGLYMLEINTQPGLTAESIGPSQVAFNGTPFAALCAYLVESAYNKAQTTITKRSEKAA